MDKTSLDGKVAIVTGAGQGIGRAITLVLARRGAHVIVADICDDLGCETLELLSAGTDADFVHVDVADETSWANLVAATVERFGRLDIACNNAGLTPGYGPLADLETSDWNGLLAVNLTGVFLGMKAQIPAMLHGGGGAIVNIGSVASVIGQPGLAQYVAAKHGVIGLTKTAALEYSARGIRVNAVLPAVIRTPMTEKYESLQPELIQQFISHHPIGRIGDPEEVGEAVAWLASDAASFVTGAALPVDGGYTAQ